VLPSVRIEKAICNITDPEYARLDLCVVKSNKNNIRGLSMTLLLLKGPLTNCHVNTQLFHVPAKRSVLLTNRTWDLCKHLKTGRGSIPALFIIGLLKQFSNLNQTCPLG
ncbi:uncharacterized protein LOC142242425, partial [Haematobia irritans]|uniref:uncharacterized protein LOC142242425 n=1 Tax=Haematobia irritans TaxID=7368 RepID=UPI003F50C927